MKHYLPLMLFVAVIGNASHCFCQIDRGGAIDPNRQMLLRSIPENEGVSSEGIIDFLDEAGKSRHEFHSFMFLRHGKVIAEGWWKPYRSGLNHSLYSVTKSFVSTAVGLAVGEGRIKLSDKVISFFPESLPDIVSPYLSQLTIKDLLIMSVGQDPDPTPQVTTQDNWIKASLAVPIVHQPGTKFLYNNIGPNLLSAIIQKQSGQKLIDYLRQRLFVPLGIQGMDWEVDPQSINTGGWGLRVTTEAMAKLGQLYLQKGMWNGRQVLSRQWIEEATSFKIQQDPALSQAQRDSSDWQQGYGYYFWRCRNDAYRGDGAFGQFIIVFPDEDAVVVLTAETQDMQDEINLVWKYLLPAMHENKLPANNKMAALLKQKLHALALQFPGKNAGSQLEQNISGKSFTLQPNNLHMQAVTLQFGKGICTALLKTGTAAYKIIFDAGKWRSGETARHGPYLAAQAKANLTGLPPFKIASGYLWLDDHTLELIIRYIESPHTERIICRFNNNDLVVNIHNSLFPSQVTVLAGKAR